MVNVQDDRLVGLVSQRICQQESTKDSTIHAILKIDQTQWVNALDREIRSEATNAYTCSSTGRDAKARANFRIGIYR